MPESLDFNGLVYQNSIKGMARLIQTVNNLNVGESYRIVKATGVTSNPPTVAEIVALFDTAARIGPDVILAILDTTNSRYWLLFTDGLDFYYVAMGLAV